MEKKKIVLYVVIGIILILLILSSFGMINFRPGTSASKGDYSNLPEECRPPAGQDIVAWKEHLGHHQNTLYCLDYYK